MEEHVVFTAAIGDTSMSGNDQKTQRHNRAEQELDACARNIATF